MIGHGRLASRLRAGLLPNRWRAGRLSRAFAQSCRLPAETPLWVGLEHEFLVFDVAGARVDFRTVVPELGLGRPDLVPGDRHAYRLASGSVVTADTTEAEIATPPADLRSGFTERVDGWAAYERAALLTRVAPLGLTLRGDSTHISVTLPGDVDADRVADLFAARFAAGLMLLMDRSTSPGLLVRPRPFRLELGGEYVVGDALRAALAYAAGATLACVAWLRGQRQVELPPALSVRLERGELRYGWYVDRHAHGVDLYSAGRAAPLATVAGTSTSAQEQLARAWEVARASLAGLAAGDDLRPADDLVAGTSTLPIERTAAEQEQRLARPRRPRSPFGSALRAARRPGYDVAPVMLTWQAGVWLVARRDRRRGAFVAVPGSSLAGFVDRLRAGELDALIEAYIAVSPSGRRLSRPTQARAPGIYDELGLRSGLLAPERDLTGRLPRYRVPRHSVPAGIGLAQA